jgi:hypothetical protein
MKLHHFRMIFTKLAKERGEVLWFFFRIQISNSIVMLSLDEFRRLTSRENDTKVDFEMFPVQGFAPIIKDLNLMPIKT